MKHKLQRSTLLLLFCLIISPNSQSLILIEPSIDPHHKKELLQDLRQATGLWIDLQKDFLRELPPALDLITLGAFRNISPTAKQFLLDALNSNEVYRVRASQNTRFGNSADQIDLNLNQLQAVTYRNVPRQAFGAGIILMHELAHSHRALLDPDPIQKKLHPDIKGPTVEFINVIQRELGLPERQHYFAKKVNGRDDVYCIYFGNAARVEIKVNSTTWVR